MGNRSNRDQWAGRERQRFIERLAWWRGIVNRGDLHDIFGISAAQASADLQAYIELNPTAMVYNLRAKRYEAQPGMACVLHEPRLEDAVSLFLGTSVPGLAQMPGAAAGVNAEAKVDMFQPLARRTKAVVERRLFLALDQGRRIRVRYWSVNRGDSRRREIAPHALGYDGYRWHVRAWCSENKDYRDFVLSRMESADWPGDALTPEREDEDWQRIERVALRPHSSLSEEQRKAMEYDYGMVKGKLEVEVRSAMKEYLLAHLRIPVVDSEGQARPMHLELDTGRTDAARTKRATRAKKKKK